MRAHTLRKSCARKQGRLSLSAVGLDARRFKPPWTAERIPGGYVVKDANGQSLAYVYARETGANRYELAHLARLRTCPRGLETRRVTSRYISPSREISPT